MKALYLIQTYKNPNQIYRLVQTIKKSSPESYVLVSHNFAYSDLDVVHLKNLPQVEVISGKGGRGDFSLMQGYLDAIEWLFDHNIEFDWLTNLTGQDYPTQPLTRIESFLAETKYDGFLEYFDSFFDSEYNPWGNRIGRDRYLFQYWRSGLHIPLFESGYSVRGRILNRIGVDFNKAQPCIRISWAFDDGLVVGVRASSTPFNEKFLCFGGSFFHTLSRKCVRFLNNFSKQNNHVVDFYKKTSTPDESLIQTILVNSKKFNLCNENKRYIDFSSCLNGRPRILTVDDYPVLIRDNIHFARKFDLAHDSKIINMLDARILPGS
ncbi:MAG: core-2/I-branching enzyme [Chroococcidiopsidaceae cyanobacterium CP_BM_ER_R8_30]|nr:core-2/I-branching enzyme [Chroococcidiopsidaceae cyanobacterium CP_BM_ER_R8_30]